MTDIFERLKREMENEMDLGAIWTEEYKAVLAKEIVEEVKQRARKEAEDDIRDRRAEEAGIYEGYK